MTPEIRKLAEELLALAGKAKPSLPSAKWTDYAAWIGVSKNPLARVDEDRSAAFFAYIAACSPDAITNLAREVLGQETCLSREHALLILPGVLEPFLFGDYKGDVLKGEACAAAIFDRFDLIEKAPPMKEEE